MFDYNKGEASALGFEPLSAQSTKPEISVVNLSDYTQVVTSSASLEACEQPPTPSQQASAPLHSGMSSSTQVRGHNYFEGNYVSIYAIQPILHIMLRDLLTPFWNFSIFLSVSVFDCILLKLFLTCSTTFKT
jgi:hypothetical protein